jgi:hypothetical protein
VTLQDGRVVETVTITVPATGIALKPPQGPVAIFPRQDYLPIKALAQPIVTGGAVLGWTWGFARNVKLEEVTNSNSAIILSFTDVQGKAYEIRRSTREAKFEVIDPDSLRDINPQ